jgi:hypothetical protein
MRKVLNFLTLFTSTSTLICCALPALLVALGMGAALAGMVSRFPQLIWISEHKDWVFGVGAIFLVAGGFAQWNARNLPCPADPQQARACAAARRWSLGIYFVSVSLFLIGAIFAYGLSAPA